MRIAITTPNRRVGQYLTRMLICSNVRPLLLTMHPENVTSDLEAYVDVAMAGTFDVEQVVPATKGVDAIYWVVPPPRLLI